MRGLRGLLWQPEEEESQKEMFCTAEKCLERIWPSN